MEFLDVVRRRKTTNGPFLSEPVPPEHQRLLIEVAARAPSQLNCQPWRFVVTEDRSIIEQVATISGHSMAEALSNGTFFERYQRYFRFSDAEMDARRDGILFDKLPAPLRPFARQVLTSRGQRMLNTLRVPQTLGEENRKLVAGSPLLLAVLLDRTECRAGELSSFYSVFSIGAAMENVWLTTEALGMGMQLISFPREVPGQWARIEHVFGVPDELELMVVYRLGYLPAEYRRAAIAWSSHQRKLISHYVFRDRCDKPQQGWDDIETPRD